ncbi:hypothetical protein [Clostridium sp.]|uniref:hypothetical protein n=1 Tax=Clostridium sp. TaxID=1506 RepID=UPI003D6D3CDA
MRFKGRKLGNEEDNNEEGVKDIDVLDRYVKIQGMHSKLVNIPTIVTGLNEDGTIREEKIEPYAYEIVDQNKGFID